MAEAFDLVDVRREDYASSNESFKSMHEQQECRSHAQGQADEQWSRACHASYVRAVCNSSSSSAEPGNSTSIVGAKMQLDDSLCKQPLQYQQKKKMVHAHFHGIKDTQLAASLPVMASGEPSSMGSMLHKSKICQPCHWMMFTKGCKDGMHCMYCHLGEHPGMPPRLLEAQHDAWVEQRGRTEMEKNRKRVRPSRQMREEYKQAVAQYEAEIRKDPLNFQLESVVFPDFMCDAIVRMKFLRRLDEIAAKVIADSPQMTLLESAALPPPGRFFACGGPPSHALPQPLRLTRSISALRHA